MSEIYVGVEIVRVWLGEDLGFYVMFFLNIIYFMIDIVIDIGVLDEMDSLVGVLYDV